MEKPEVHMKILYNSLYTPCFRNISEKKNTSPDAFKHTTDHYCLVAILSVMMVMASHFCNAQMYNPVKWHFMATPADNQEVVLTFTASMDEGWHVYSQFIEEGGPLPTTFTIKPSDDYQLIGKVKEESKAVKSFDETFAMDILWFEKTAIFTQRVKLQAATSTIKGSVEYMACNDQLCLPPEIKEFSLNVKVEQGAPQKSRGTQAGPKTKDIKKSKSAGALEKRIDTTTVRIADQPKKSEQDTVIKVTSVSPQPPASQNNEVNGSPEQEARHASSAGRSMWGVFIAGFLGGLAAIFMPCIFPMLPFTVGYFMKQGASRRKSVGTGLLYGLSIIILYVALGLLIAISFGPDTLNDLSTNGVLNFFFFLLLLVFAASFLGAFEIMLPSSWINKADANADKGGLMGVFFMAATLALVSFSCTGPIIGTLLVEAALLNGLYGPATGMLGFAIALALPFTLFAMFPSWLKALPKSGGWLNSVKVVLGFLELALALKFLSNVDLAYHWNWFDREVFLVLWIIIFGLLGVYLLGKLKLPQDQPLEHLSPLRLLLAIVTLAFTLYLIPGLWGAPLKAVAAILPPQQTQDFDLYTHSLSPNNVITVSQKRKKYDDIFHAPHNLNAFFDYEEGLAYARSVNKPVMIDFTGHACVNCRKMEAVIWPHPDVLKRLRDDYVLIQLYVDDKTALPKEEQRASIISDRVIKTIGNKWSELQASAYHTNAQPYYVLLDPEGIPLTEGKGADYDVDSFRLFLDEGLNIFNARVN